jgi:hypothetical protein
MGFVKFSAGGYWIAARGNDADLIGPRTLSGHGLPSELRVRAEHSCSAGSETLRSECGLTMVREDCQSLQTSHSRIQRSRSAHVSLGRFTGRRRTPSWCRRPGFSNWSVARDLKAVDDRAAAT